MSDYEAARASLFLPQTAVSVLSDAEREAVASIPDRIAAGPDCCFFCWAGERDRELVELRASAEAAQC